MCDLDGSLVLRHDGEAVSIAQVILGDDILVQLLVADDGNDAICVTRNGRIVGWHRQDSGFVEFTYELGPGPAIRYVCADWTGCRLCVIRSDGSVTFHRSATGDLEGPNFNLGSTNLSVTWNCDQQSIVAVTDKGLIQVIDASSGRILHKVSSRQTAAEQRGGRQESRPTESGSRFDDLSTVICIWNTTSDSEPQKCGHTAMVERSICAGSDRLYSGSYDGTVRMVARHACTRIVD